MEGRKGESEKEREQNDEDDEKNEKGFCPTHQMNVTCSCWKNKRERKKERRTKREQTREKKGRNKTEEPFPSVKHCNN